MLFVQCCGKYVLLPCVMYSVKDVIIRLIWGFKTPDQPLRLCDCAGCMCVGVIMNGDVRECW
jgi:hypothetical protein